MNKILQVFLKSTFFFRSYRDSTFVAHRIPITGFSLFALVSVFFTLFLSQNASAQWTLGLTDTAEVLGQNRLRAQGETQYAANQQSFNFRGRMAVNIQPDSDLQGELSFNGDAYWIGGFWKWVPFPDTPRQPAVGARMGFFYGRSEERNTFYGVQWTPTVSKIISVGKLGQVIPFAGLPLALENTTDSTTLMIKGTAGVEYTHPQWPLVHILMEYGQPLLNSDYHISFAVSYDL